MMATRQLVTLLNITLVTSNISGCIAKLMIIHPRVLCLAHELIKKDNLDF